MRRSTLLGLLGALGLALGLVGCGTTGAGAPATPGSPVATAGEVRFSLPTPHRVVAERRTPGGWADARVVFEDRGRECGRVHAIAVGSTVAATVDCDEHFAEDQAPTRSVALVGAVGRGWAHHDLEGEASGTPGLAPHGGRAVWSQDGSLLTWHAGSFGTAPLPTGYAQVVTVEDSGTVTRAAPRSAAGRCTVTIRSGDAAPVVVPVAEADELSCDEVGLELATPTEIRGDLSAPGTEFVVRRSAPGRWELGARPPVTAPGLARYPDDPTAAVWNEVTANTGGDLVAVGSPDREHVTAQRYDRARQRWTPARVVHTAAGPTCRRRTDDAGLVQGAVFALRLVCDGEPVVLRSRTGRTWSR